MSADPQQPYMRQLLADTPSLETAKLRSRRGELAGQELTGRRSRQAAGPLDHPHAELPGDLSHHVLHGHGVRQRHDLALGVPAGHPRGDLGELVGIAVPVSGAPIISGFVPAAVQHDPAG